MTAGWPRVSRLGEETILVEFEPRLDPEVNAAVHQLARRIRHFLAGAGVLDVVPGIASVAVHVDGDLVDAVGFEEQVRQLASQPDVSHRTGTLHEVPVCYDAQYALDMDAVADRCGCAASNVVEWHCGVEYRVFMIGFLPGFPYLGVLDPRLAVPRRDTPRMRVPAGSVAIAGQQTGIYPFESPGGWHVIGRTPLTLFNPALDPPTRFEAEDRIRFVPIPSDKFVELDAIERPPA